jgi:hypothetical protein
MVAAELQLHILEKLQSFHRDMVGSDPGNLRNDHGRRELASLADGFNMPLK